MEAVTASAGRIDEQLTAGSAENAAERRMNLARPFKAGAPSSQPMRVALATPEDANFMRR